MFGPCEHGNCWTHCQEVGCVAERTRQADPEFRKAVVASYSRLPVIITKDEMPEDTIIFEQVEEARRRMQVAIDRRYLQDMLDCW